MKKTGTLTVLLLALLSAGCRRASAPAGFAYRYSMESVGNYKVELVVNPDSTYVIGRYDYFFDRFERTSRPQHRGGNLTGDEYRTFRKLIDRSRLEKMRDSYGFDHPDADGSVVYIVELTRGGETKYVSVNGGAKQAFSRHFNRLIRYSAEFIDQRMDGW